MEDSFYNIMEDSFTIVVWGILSFQSMESIFCIVVKKLFLLLKICPSGVVFYECGRAADIDRVGPLHLLYGSTIQID